MIDEVHRLQKEIEKRYLRGKEIPKVAVSELLPLLGPDWSTKMFMLQWAIDMYDQGVHP